MTSTEWKALMYFIGVDEKTSTDLLAHIDLCERARCEHPPIYWTGFRTNLGEVDYSLGWCDLCRSVGLR